LNWIRTGMRMMYGTSPLGLIAIGGLLAVTLTPTAKKAARRAAVVTTKGVLTIAGASSNMANKVKENMNSIVEEATEQANTNKVDNLKNKMMVRNRAMAVGATKGVLKVTGTVSNMRNKVKSHMAELVEEARKNENTTQQTQTPPEE